MEGRKNSAILTALNTLKKANIDDLAQAIADTGQAEAWGCIVKEAERLQGIRVSAVLSDKIIRQDTPSIRGEIIYPKIWHSDKSGDCK